MSFILQHNVTETNDKENTSLALFSSGLTHPPSLARTRSQSIRRRARPETTENVGNRLAARKQLFGRRRILADLCFVMAIMGFGLGMIVAELYHLQLLDRENASATNSSMDSGGHFSQISYRSTLKWLKWTITASTVILLLCLMMYHVTDIRIFCLDNCNFHREDFQQAYWRFALTPKRVFFILLEIIVCVIQPTPWARYKVYWEGMKVPGATNPADYVPLDVILVVLMSMRSYLLGRVLLLHSSLFQGSSAQSLGALNKVNFNFYFVFKSLMNLYAEYVLAGLIFGVLLWCSWALRVCEMNTKEFNGSFLQSFWLVTITFLTIGYGDLVPSTHCGRAVAIVAGTFGAFITALVVAVLARKLELSHSEKHVQDYVINVELGKAVKQCAANIIRESWLAFKFQRECDVRKTQLHIRKLMACIARNQELKERQRRQADNSLGFRDIYRMQMAFEKNLERIQHQLDMLRPEVISVRPHH